MIGRSSLEADQSGCCRRGAQQDQWCWWAGRSLGWGAGEKPDRVCGGGEECLSFQVLGRSQARRGGVAAGEARKVMAGIAEHLLGTTERRRGPR